MGSVRAIIEWISVKTHSVAPTYLVASICDCRNRQWRRLWLVAAQEFMILVDEGGYRGGRNTVSIAGWFSGSVAGRRRSTRRRLAVAIGLTGLVYAPGLRAQTPQAGEVRQLVTFTFLPGRASDAVAMFRERAKPLYEDDAHMRSFRAFREVESPVPMDLMVVSSFDGMAAMDRSNALLSELARDAGTSIADVYGGIAAASTGHTDQFVEMLPELGWGDPSESRLTAFVWFRIPPGEGQAFERALRTVAEADREGGVPSATGRFLVSDGWDYLRILGFDSLGAFQDYRRPPVRGVRAGPLTGLTVQRRQVILSQLPALAVR